MRWMPGRVLLQGSKQCLCLPGRRTGAGGRTHVSWDLMQRDAQPSVVRALRRMHTGAGAAKTSKRLPRELERWGHVRGELVRGRRAYAAGAWEGRRRGSSGGATVEAGVGAGDAGLGGISWATAEATSGIERDGQTQRGGA